ncbi:MAG TPA: ribulose-phosphate 3-epimerase [Candidatus Dormibacteraeota bacterium]|nr:ribulose-phosphate 3-epimerase [Candidatus Dormibacteraeota bacterium]
MTRTKNRVEIAPSILAANFACLEREIQAAESGGARSIHVDVMDGHFVPNLTIGVPVVASIRAITTLPIGVHLMIDNPGDFIDPFVRAGADRLYVHQEATPHLDRVLNAIRDRGVEAAVAINPATPSSLLSEVLDLASVILVMTVNPGFGGQRFIPRSIGKIRELTEIRARYNGTFRIAVDGGIGLENVDEVVRAGAEILVAGTSVFHTPDAGAAVRQLLDRAQEALTLKV